MNRADEMYKNNMNQPDKNTGLTQACNRRDLAKWSQRGGPLPGKLADHVTKCPACAHQVRSINQTYASITMLRNQPTPKQFYAKSNNRALKMLKRITRASEKAKHLLTFSPNLSPWQRAQLYVARVSLSAAAAVIILAIRAGTLTGFDKTQEYGETLASLHWERHIDPDGEWFGPQNWA